MIRPPFRARAVPQLRAELLEPGPYVFDSAVPMTEFSQLLSPEQRLRPSGYRYGGEAEAEAAVKLAAWHRHCITSAQLYWIEPALIRYAWTAEPRTGPLPLYETFTDMPDYGLAVFGEPIEVPLPDGRKTPIVGASWAPMRDVPWPAEVFSVEGLSGSGRPELAPFPDAATQAQWRHLRFFTTGIAGPIADLLAAEGVREPSMREEFDVPLHCVDDVGLIGHARPGVMEAYGDVYNMPRALHIAFLLARSTRIGHAEAEAVVGSERRRAAKRGVPYPDGDDAQIRLMSMRPAVRDAVLGTSGTDAVAADGVFRRPARYTLPLWYVSPSVDTDTGKIKKSGYWAARSPELLADAPTAHIVHTASLPRKA